MKFKQKRASKKNIVSVIEDLDAAAVKPCNVRLMKLQECKGHYKASDIVKPTPLSKHEKTLLIPKKVRKEAAKAAPKKRGRKPKKGGKFQLKIRDWFYFKSVHIWLPLYSSLGTFFSFMGEQSAWMVPLFLW